MSSPNVVNPSRWKLIFNRLKVGIVVLVVLVLGIVVYRNLLEAEMGRISGTISTEIRAGLEEIKSPRHIPNSDKLKTHWVPALDAIAKYQALEGKLKNTNVPARLREECSRLYRNITLGLNEPSDSPNGNSYAGVALDMRTALTALESFQQRDKSKPGTDGIITDFGTAAQLFMFETSVKNVAASRGYVFPK